MNSKTDQELIATYKSTKDLKVLGELYEKYMSLVYGVCLKYLKDREDAKDAVTQVFEKLISQIIKHDIDNFKSWLHVLSKNHCLMILRADRSKSKVDFENNYTESMDYAISLHPHEELQENHLNALNGCLEKLTTEQKQCVVLFYLDEKSYKEVSDVLGFDMNKVKSFIQNGKRNLKNCIESHGH